jgi:hypothetical protein
MTTQRTPHDWQNAPEHERDAEILRLRVMGHTLAEIADHVGYASPSSIRRRIEAAYVRTVREPADLARDLEVQRLDALLVRAWKVMEDVHFAVSGGRVARRKIVDEHGLWVPLGITVDDKPIYAEEDVRDSAPVLAAIDRVLKIMERRAKLLGLDAPIRHEVITVSQIDAEIAELTARLTEAGLPPDVLADIAETDTEGE